jgi:hypothetical protein
VKRSEKGRQVINAKDAEKKTLENAKELHSLAFSSVFLLASFTFNSFLIKKSATEFKPAPPHIDSAVLIDVQ